MTESSPLSRMLLTLDQPGAGAWWLVPVVVLWLDMLYFVK